MRRFPIVTVDVFTSRALEGNGLAVFTDAHGLSDSEMQAMRPSRIFVRASRDGSRIFDVRVGGHVVEVLRGEVTLP